MYDFPSFAVLLICRFFLILCSHHFLCEMAMCSLEKLHLKITIIITSLDFFEQAGCICLTYGVISFHRSNFHEDIHRKLDILNHLLFLCKPYLVAIIEESIESCIFYYICNYLHSAQQLFHISI